MKQLLRFNVFGFIAGAALVLILVSACKDDGTPSEELTRAAVPSEGASAGTRVLPTLYPTRTPPATPEPTETVQPRPTDVPDTPIAFDQTVVELSYSIPAIGLDRSLRGNVSSALELHDEATGEDVTLRDQIGVIYELQQALPELDLAPLPEECPNCVQISYNLPLAEVRSQGWLTNTQILASLENYTAAHLGPHYPEDTVLGFRRSATPYHPAHSLALLPNGSLWYWTAVDGEIPDPAPATEFLANVQNHVNDLDEEELLDAYSAPCPGGSGLEAIYLEGSPASTQIKFVCPELSLPALLLPLYVEISDQVEQLLPEIFTDEPASVVPVTSLVHFQRSDGSQMSLLNDGLVRLADSAGIVYTQTLTVTNIISMTAALLEDPNLADGAAVFNEETTENILFVRGPEAVYTVGWPDGESPLRRESLTLVDLLLEEMLEISVPVNEDSAEEDGSDSALPTPTGTAEP